MSKRAIAALVLTVATAPGCSLLLVKGPPSYPRPAAGWSCTQSRSLPAIDLVAGISMGALAVDAGTGYPSAVPAYGGLGVGFLASAFVGNTRVSACREWLLAPVDTTTATMPWLQPEMKRPLLTPEGLVGT